MTVTISRRPKNIPKLNNHLALSGSGLNVPAGPIISPSPGPTLEIAVAAPDMAVIKSSPTYDSAMAKIAKLRAYRKTKLITESGMSFGSGLLLK